MAKNFLSTQGWLSFSPSTPRLYITAEDEVFDQSILRAWKNEGFMVGYIPMGRGGPAYKEKLESLGRGLGVGEKYAIIAFGSAASYVLEQHIIPRPLNARLCSIVAYYPTRIPVPNTRFPSHIRVLCHLTGTSISVSHVPEILGIQGKRRSVRKTLKPGSGPSGQLLSWGYRAYTYPVEVQEGFAERDLEDVWDGIAEGLAWSRSLAHVRASFNAEVEMEKPLDAKLDAQWTHPTDDIDSILSAYADEPLKNEAAPTPVQAPYVLATPTLTGGFGARLREHSLSKFYDRHFVPGSMEEANDLHLRTRLLSRTVGATSVVDELQVSLVHNIMVPWLLPGIAPTGRRIEVVICCVVTLKGGRIECERMYWDQASVLVQAGLLNSGVTGAGRKNGRGVHEALPVVGKEGVQRILDVMGGRGWRERRVREEREINGDDSGSESDGSVESEKSKNEKIAAQTGLDGLDGVNHMAEN